MKASSVKAQVLPSSLAGLRREPLRYELFIAEPDQCRDPQTALAALSLCGLSLRFEWPERPDEFNTSE